MSANIGVGVQFRKGQHLTYSLRAKKALPFTSDGSLGLNIKARLLLTDTDFNPVSHSPSPFTSSDGSLGLNIQRMGLSLIDSLCSLLQREGTGAVELAWTLLDLRKGQDVRLKLGYELHAKVNQTDPTHSSPMHK
jgi:hypothetical protein